MRYRREGKHTNRQRRSVRHQEKKNESSAPVQPGDDWVPLQAPENLDEMLLNLVNYEGPKVGWCG